MRRNGPSRYQPRNKRMTHSRAITTRLAAFAGAILLATLSLAASVGPAMTNLPIA